MMYSIYNFTNLSRMNHVESDTEDIEDMDEIRIVNANTIEFDNSVDTPIETEDTHESETMATYKEGLTETPDMVHNSQPLSRILSSSLTQTTPWNHPTCTIKELIARFCPFFVFTQNDPHRPMSWETILRSSQVANWDGSIALSNPDLVTEYSRFKAYCASECVQTREIGDIRAIESCPYQLRMVNRSHTSSEQMEIYCMLSEPIWNGVRWGMYLTYWIWVPTFRAYRLLDRRFRKQHSVDPLKYTCSGRKLTNTLVQKSMRKIKADGDGYSAFDPHHPDAPWVSHPGVVSVYFECSHIEDIEGSYLSLSDIQQNSSSIDSLNESIRCVSPRLMRIYMSRYNRGRWYRPEDCEMQAGRVYAYAVEGTEGRVFLPKIEKPSFSFMKTNRSKQFIVYDGGDNIVSLVPPHHSAFEEEIQGSHALYYFSGVVGNDISPVFVPQLQMPWLAIDIAVDPINPFSRKSWCNTLTRYTCTSLALSIWTYGSIEPFIVLYVEDYPFWLMVLTRSLVVLSSLIFTRILMR